MPDPQAQDRAISALRRELSASSSTRARDTRARILGALETLTAEGAEISTASLVRAAGVSRSTFYTHFRGMEDVADHVQTRALGLAGDAVNEALAAEDAGAVLQAHVRLVEHFDRYRHLYAYVFRLPRSRHPELALAEAIQREVAGRLRDFALPAGRDSDVVAAYLAAGTAGLIVGWITGRIRATPEAVADHLVAFLPEWLGTPGSPQS